MTPAEAYQNLQTQMTVLGNALNAVANANVEAGNAVSLATIQADYVALQAAVAAFVPGSSGNQ